MNVEAPPSNAAMVMAQHYEQLEMEEMQCIVPGPTRWRPNMHTLETYYFDVQACSLAKVNGTNGSCI